MLYPPGGNRCLYGRLLVAAVEAAVKKSDRLCARSRARRSRGVGAAQSQARNRQRQARQVNPAEATQTIAARRKERVSCRQTLLAIHRPNFSKRWKRFGCGLGRGAKRKR